MSKVTSHIDGKFDFPVFDYESLLGDLSSISKGIQTSFETINGLLSKSPSIPEISNILLDNISNFEVPTIPKDLFVDYKLFTYPKESGDIQQDLSNQIKSSNTEGISLTADSTDSNAINQNNESFLGFLQARTTFFVIALRNTDFEDGMTNEVSDEVEGYMSQNKFATYLWFHSLYSRYQTDYEVISGLLRIINLTVEKSDSNLLLPIVKCGLCDSHVETQESAIMVVERWRSKECLDALQTASFSSKWIQAYAKAVASELKLEIGDVD